MSRFSDEQIRRYSRQILLREVGGVGQTRLGAACPVLFCADEVGQVAAEYLWRAGVTAPTLLARDDGEAARLTAQLVATGYPGVAAQAVSAASAQYQQLIQRVPGFTLLWLPDATLLWACREGSWGGIGQGITALHETAAAHPRAVMVAGASGSAAMVVGASGSAAMVVGASGSAVMVAGASGSAAMILGSALALLAMQKILGMAPVAADAASWQIDLASTELPVWR